jgi:hypothetical protein
VVPAARPATPVTPVTPAATTVPAAQTVPAVMVAPPVGGVAGARGVEAAAEVAKAEVLRQARTDVELVRARIDRIKQDFFEIGVVLGRLKQPAAYGALGYASFAELCKRALKLSVTTALELVSISANMSPELARGVGQKNALELVTLCRATPEDDTPEEMAGAQLPLPSGEVLDVANSTVREKQEAAKAIREARRAAEGLADKPTRGRSTTARERSTAADLQKRLRAAGLERARVEAVARGAALGADLAIDRVPMAQMATLCAVMCGKAKRRGG